ncbi:MAG: M15 family metallopeptidase [Clostridiales bacterium]|nr:M15 family metallopeptidase [Clostridiales bacterium]
MRQFVAIFMLCLSLVQSSVTGIVAQTNLGGNLYLVNRTYRLTEHYVPKDLVKPQVKTISGETLMRQEAASALELLFQSAREQGYTLVAVSGFRSYATQRIIYNRKITNSGKRMAELYVAPAGASEHQLGLAMDIGRRSGSGLNGSFGKTKEGQWVAENAHRFGFIIRYKEDWTQITGYAYEPWHIRYVGVEHATAIYQLDIPLETYIEELSKTTYGGLLSHASQPQD